VTGNSGAAALPTRDGERGDNPKNLPKGRFLFQRNLQSQSLGLNHRINDPPGQESSWN
jgi:hypothetical protein